VSALASLFHEEEHDPRSAVCAGCKRRLNVNSVKNDTSNKPRAFSEDRDAFGRERYWCRPCTADLWRKAST
jgi:hypothetical protein